MKTKEHGLFSAIDNRSRLCLLLTQTFCSIFRLLRLNCIPKWYSLFILTYYLQFRLPPPIVCIAVMVKKKKRYALCLILQCRTHHLLFAMFFFLSEKKKTYLWSWSMICSLWYIKNIIFFLSLAASSRTWLFAMLFFLSEKKTRKRVWWRAVGLK